MAKMVQQIAENTEMEKENTAGGSQKMVTNHPNQLRKKLA